MESSEVKTNEQSKSKIETTQEVWDFNSDDDF